MTDRSRALSFGAAASAYAAARPSYPVDAVRWVLPPDARRVLDLGAGTGKLTSVLLDLGLDVVAVEPDDAMRALIDPRAEVLPGTAEAVPDIGLVDAVVVGQAWHWFDAAATLASVRRVLRPAGTLGLLWNLLDDRHGWLRQLPALLQLEDLVSRMEPEAAAPFGAPAAGLAWSQRLVEHTHPADKALVLQTVASRSVVLVMPDDERQQLFARLEQLVPDDVTGLPYVCDAWRTLVQS